MAITLTYDGKTLTWNGPDGVVKFNASSGLREKNVRMFRSDGWIFVFVEDYRCTWYQTIKDRGPVPNGVYKVATTVPKHPFATYDEKTCSIYNSFSVQQIPRGGDITDHPTTDTAGSCEPYWANWGFNRTALMPLGWNAAPHRSGFYLHDSAKGYSHGCIEVDQAFFSTKLYPIAKKHPGIDIRLVVKYSSDDFHTYGNTYAKAPDTGGLGLDDKIQRQCLLALKDLMDRLKARKLVADDDSAKSAHRPAHLTLDPPPQDRLRLYDPSMNLIYGANQVSMLRPEVAAKAPPWWNNFVEPGKLSHSRH
jgi:hypothetical protein